MNNQPTVDPQATPNPATTNWVPVGPGPMPDFRYRGDYVAATNYSDGDIAIYNGIAYLCVAPTSTAPVPWALLPVTTTPGCHVSRSTNQTIPTGVETVLTFDNERFDTDNIHDTVTNTSRLTCRTAGKYVVTATVTFNTSSGGTQRYAFPRLNGTGSLGYFKSPTFASTAPAVSGAQIVDLVAGDYLELLAYQDSGGNLDVLSGGVGPTGQWSPEFSMMKIEGAAGPTGPQGVPGTPAATAPGYGTTLPASPADGQETILVDSTTNPSYQWRFRYNATSTSAYKWEFVGGPLGQRNIDTGVAVSTTGWQAAPGPVAIVVPRAGEYTSRYSSEMTVMGAGTLYVLTVSSTAGTLFPGETSAIAYGAQGSVTQPSSG